MPMPKFLQKLPCCKSGTATDGDGEGGGGIMDKATNLVGDSWAQPLLDKTILAQSIVQYAVICTFPDAQIKAKNFEINEQGLANIIKALEGDTTAIADEGIILSATHPTYSPGKIGEGSYILGTAIAVEGEEKAAGGCAIYKTLSHLIVATFEKDLEGASNFIGKIAGGLKDKGL